MDYINYKHVYTAGDMLHKSQFEYRKQQKEELEGIEGIEVLNPSSNPEINDKKNADTFKLAERIVEQDTLSIEKADIYVIDLPTADAGGRGTVAEIGQIYQMRREARKVKYIMENKENYTKEDTQLIRDCEDIINKPCLVYSDDVRWNTSDMNDDMDRVPYSFNAYTYGLVMDITDGEGVISWDEVLKRLEKLGAKN